MWKCFCSCYIRISPRLKTVYSLFVLYKIPFLEYVVLLLANLGVPAAGLPRRTSSPHFLQRDSLLFFPTPAASISPSVSLHVQPLWDPTL